MVFRVEGSGCGAYLEGGGGPNKLLISILMTPTSI